MLKALPAYLRCVSAGPSGPERFRLNTFSLEPLPAIGVLAFFKTGMSARGQRLLSQHVVVYVSKRKAREALGLARSLLSLAQHWPSSLTQERKERQKSTALLPECRAGCINAKDKRWSRTCAFVFIFQDWPIPQCEKIKT